MGRLIVIDGLDGSGKATQTEILVNEFKSRGELVKHIEYPNYESHSSDLVKLYLNGEISKDPFSVNAYATTSFYACDHYIQYEINWKQDYLANKTIVSDRYVSSNAIHQMVKLPKNEWDFFLNWLYDYEFNKLGLPKENKLIYIDVDPLISQNLINSRYDNIDKRDIHEKNINYLLQCREAALYAAKLLKWEIVRCDNGSEIMPIEKISKQILKLVDEVD